MPPPLTDISTVSPAVLFFAMPKLGHRICRAPGCKSVVEYRRDYCDEHQDRRREWDHGGKTRHDRGYGNKWDKLRKRILKRDHQLCQVCLKAGKISEAREVDHIVPKARGGTDIHYNLQAICSKCHRTKTGRESG